MDSLGAATGDGRSVALIQLLGEVDHRGASRVRLHNTAYIEDTAWAHRQITKPLDVVANHRGLPTTTTEVWAEARLGWRASFGPRRL